jgi:hypothetical protein
MGILNRPSDGLFNVLALAYGTLSIKGSLSKEELVSKCAPGVVDNTQLSNTLNRWTQLGLFVEEEGKLTIGKSYRMKKKTDYKQSMIGLPKILRLILLDSANNENFWDSENSRAADFTRGISWLLAQDVYKFDAKNFDIIQQYELAQIGISCRVLQNDTRWAGLRSWAGYLGFGWESKTYVIDPTVAIRESLDEVFQKSKQLPIAAFIESLHAMLPVFDGGTYRKAVENKLSPTVWNKPSEYWLSTSLSRALKRLHISGHIKLEKRTDAGEIRFFTGQSGRQWDEPVSHVMKSDRGTR